MTAPPTVNRRLVLACRPAGMIDGAVVRLEEAAMPELGADEALVAFGTSRSTRRSASG